MERVAIWSCVQAAQSGYRCGPQRAPVPKVKAAEIRTPKTADPEAQPKSNRRKIVTALLASIIVFATGTVLISVAWNWRVTVEQTEPGPPPLVPSEPAEPDSLASEPPPDSTEAPPRDLPEHKGEQAVPKELTLEKPELASGTGARCANVLHRLQLGEFLSDQDRSYLQRECAR